MKAYPDVKVKVVTAASGTYEQTLTSEMDKSEAPTLFVIGSQAGVKEWGSYAMDLTDTAIVKAQNTDAYNLSDKDGKLVSVGYCYECYGIVVNTDLLDKAGHSVDDIKDFDSLKTVVEDIHKNAATLGFDAFVATDLDSSASWRVTGHLANLEYYYEEKDAGGWTECPSSIKGTYMGWRSEANPADVEMAKRYLGLNDEEGFAWGFIRGGMSSVAELFMRIQAEFVDGFGTLAEIGPAVAVFGSARTACSDPMYAAAKNVGRRLAKENVAVITGGGSGIMFPLTSPPPMWLRSMVPKRLGRISSSASWSRFSWMKALLPRRTSPTSFTYSS